MNELQTCLKCKSAIPVSKDFMDIHRAPEFYYDFITGGITEVEKNDLAVFQNEHAGCCLEKLLVVSGPYCRTVKTEPTYMEPVKIKYYEVKAPETNVRVPLVLKGWRERIDEAFRYTIFKGWIEVKIHSVDLDTSVVVKQLDGKINDAVLKSFVNKIRNVLKWEKLLVRFSMFHGPDPHLDKGDAVVTTDPMTYFVRPSGNFSATLYDFTRNFYPQEARILREFIAKECQSDGLLAVVVKYDFTVHGEDARP